MPFVAARRLKGCCSLGRCVTIATMLTGHISILKGLAYVIAQIAGATLGSLLTGAP